MANREITFTAVGKGHTIRFTQRALEGIEKNDIRSDNFFESLQTPSKLRIVLLAGLEAWRVREKATIPPYSPDDASAIIEDLGMIPVRVLVGKAFNLASGVPAEPDAPAGGPPAPNS